MTSAFAPHNIPPATFFGSGVPRVWNAPATRSLFGDVVLVLFLLAQCLDGVLTYVGVVTFGPGIEANPLIALAMTHLGHGPGLLGAKLLAAALGIGLHLQRVHGAVAALSGFYLLVAILPWMLLLSR